ncbi:MAG: hypothetical protein R3352_07425 [Salinisphaeraceae bacterium]|nr:hypothetical protein [Salinisphaeraceae bacterium]
MSRADVQSAVKNEIGGRKAAYLEQLTEEQLSALLDAVQTAKQQEREALAKSIDGALKVVPALLRKPLKKILFPKDK